MKKVILLAGKKNSGKNHVANIIQSQLESDGYTVDQMAFATPLKQIAADTFSTSIDAVNRFKDYPESFPVHFGTAMSDTSTDFRRILQNLGTALGDICGRDLFAVMLNHQLAASTTDYTIITDLRYSEEYYTLLNDRLAYTKFYPILIEGGDTGDNHSSEQIPDLVFSYTLDNTTRQPIDDDVSHILRSINE